LRTDGGKSINQSINQHSFICWNHYITTDINTIGMLDHTHKDTINRHLDTPLQAKKHRLLDASAETADKRQVRET